MTDVFRGIFIVIGIFFLLPGLAGLYFICAIIFEYFENGKASDVLEVQTVVSCISVLAGFVGVYSIKFMVPKAPSNALTCGMGNSFVANLSLTLGLGGSLELIDDSIQLCVDTLTK